ncbi:unnamed protein product, partial [Prunus brigantina]
ASSSSRPNHFDLNVASKTTHDSKVWCPSFVSQNRHLTINDSVMMNDTTAIIVVWNFLTPMDEILLTGRSDEETIDDSMVFSIQSAASVSYMANRLCARANEIQELNTENSSLQRMLHDSYSIDTQTRLDMLQISNEKILGDHKRLMAKLKRHRPLPSEAFRT